MKNGLFSYENYLIIFTLLGESPDQNSNFSEPFSYRLTKELKKETASFERKGDNISKVGQYWLKTEYI